VSSAPSTQPDAAEQSAPVSAEDSSTVPPASTDGEQSAQPTGEARPADEAPAKNGRSRQKSTARKTRTVALTLTVTGTAEGDWQADLVHGNTRLVRGLPIPASAVARAARELHPDISGTIESVLAEAREQHRARMQELEAELEKVKRALAELSE